MASLVSHGCHRYHPPAPLLVPLLGMIDHLPPSPSAARRGRLRDPTALLPTSVHAGRHPARRLPTHRRWRGSAPPRLRVASRAIENFNGQFKAIFDCSRPVSTKGLIATRRYVLGAVLWSTNWHSCISSRRAATCGAGSSHSSRPPDIAYPDLATCGLLPAGRNCSCKAAGQAPSCAVYCMRACIRIYVTSVEDAGCPCGP